MIKFKKLKGQGFGSFVEETKFKFNLQGLNIIIAKNGSGKTTIFNLLYWVCYGQTLKDIKDVSTWSRFRTSDWKGTLGRVKFEKPGVEYEIIRCKDYRGKILGSKGKDRLVLLSNGVNITERNKKDTQQLIDSILGYSSGLFKNTILFGQRLKRLTQESGPEKKKIFDEAFESKFIKDARDKAQLKLEGKQSEFNEANNKLTILTNQRNTTKKSYTQLLNQKLELVHDRNKRIAELLSRIVTAERVIDEYSPILLKTCQRKLYKATIELTSLANIEVEIEDLEKREFRETNLTNTIDLGIGKQDSIITSGKEKYKSVLKKCPRCGQKLNIVQIGLEKEKIQESITQAKRERKRLTNQLETQKGIVNELLSQIASKKKDKDNISNLRLTIKNLEREEKSLIVIDDNIKYDKAELIQLKEQLTYTKNKKVRINLKPTKKELTIVRTAIKKLKPKHKEIKIDIKHLRWAINDVLGNKGLKAYIFDTMLKQLNNLLKYYEQFIGYRVEFNIDFNSANKDIYTLCYIGEHPCFYEELSGAQAQLVDLATAFALNDLVTAGRPINIMLFDESMDGFDEENADIVNDLIQNKALTTNIFMISHDINLQASSNKVIRMSYNKVTGQSVMKLL